MKEEVKRERKKKIKEEVTLATDKQSKIKTLSKIIYILAKISKVFMIIGAICLLISMAVVPVIIKNVKVKDNSIYIFDNKIEYKVNNNQNDLLFGEYNIGTISDDERIAFDYITSQIENVNTAKIFAYVEISLIFAIAIMIITYIIFDNIYKLFTSIHNDDTPFTEDSLNYVNKIAYLSLIALIVSFAADILTNLFFNFGITNVNLSSVVGVLVLYLVAYIYEYACMLQKDSKMKLYN